MSEELTWIGIEMDAAVFGLRQRQTILSRKVSETIVEDLLQLHPILKPSFLHWWDTGEILNVGPFSGYTANDLMTGAKAGREFAPSGIFLMLNTLIRDPKKAVEQLHSRVSGFRGNPPTTEKYDEFIAECDTRRQRAVQKALELLQTEGIEIDAGTAHAIERYAADEIAFTDLEDLLTTAIEFDVETVSAVRRARERTLALIRQESRHLGIMLWHNPYRNPRDSISEVRPSSEPRTMPPRRNRIR
jgi:hypothetical protein